MELFLTFYNIFFTLMASENAYIIEINDILKYVNLGNNFNLCFTIITVFFSIVHKREKHFKN